MINAAAIGGDGFGRPPLFVEAVRRSHATKPPTQLANSNKISARLSAIEDRARSYVAFEGGRDDPANQFTAGYGTAVKAANTGRSAEASSGAQLKAPER